MVRLITWLMDRYGPRILYLPFHFRNIFIQGHNFNFIKIQVFRFPFSTQVLGHPIWTPGLLYSLIKGISIYTYLIFKKINLKCSGTKRDIFPCSFLGSLLRVNKEGLMKILFLCSCLKNLMHIYLILLHYLI